MKHISDMYSRGNIEVRLLLKIELGFQQHSGPWDCWQVVQKDELNCNETAPKGRWQAVGNGKKVIILNHMGSGLQLMSM